MSYFASYNRFNRRAMQMMEKIADLHRMIDNAYLEGVDQSDVDKIAGEINEFDELLSSYKNTILEILQGFNEEENDSQEITGVSDENGTKL